MKAICGLLLAREPDNSPLLMGRLSIAPAFGAVFIFNSRMECLNIEFNPSDISFVDLQNVKVVLPSQTDLEESGSDVRLQHCRTPADKPKGPKTALCSTTPSAFPIHSSATAHVVVRLVMPSRILFSDFTFTK
jgi:hypothetical protein